MSAEEVPDDKRCEGVFPSGRQCRRRFIKYDGACRRSCGGDHQEPWSSMSASLRRNMPCECGSGRKTKKCCNSPERRAERSA